MLFMEIFTLVIIYKDLQGIKAQEEAIRPIMPALHQYQIESIRRYPFSLCAAFWLLHWYSFRRPRKDDRLSQPPGVNSAANRA